jgi:hypothetical protein
MEHDPPRPVRKVRACAQPDADHGSGATTIPVLRCLQEIKPSLQQAYIDQIFREGARAALPSPIPRG